MPFSLSESELERSAEWNTQEFAMETIIEAHRSVLGMVIPATQGRSASLI
jgi:hypothetical protein